MALGMGRQLLAELIGTFALVFFGSVSVTIFMSDAIKAVSGSAGIVGVAFTHGIVLAIMVYTLGKISGAAVNPAITISLFVTKKIEAVKAGMYIVVQLIGAAIAGYLHKFILPTAGSATNFGLTSPNAALGITPEMAFVIEAVLTFFLAMSVHAVVSGKVPEDVKGLAIGGTLLFSILVGGVLTGASLNPARTFGPALASMNFASHWVYWIGPIVGAVVAGFIYKYMASEEIKR